MTGLPSSPSRPVIARRFPDGIPAPAWEIALALGVVLFSVTVRLAWLEPVEIGGDALNKWQFVREWFHRFDLGQVEWNHHLTRMGVNVPLALIQAVFGRHAPVYHLAAIAFASAAALFAYVAGRLASGRTVGLGAAVWCVLFPAWVRAGSQVSPDSAGAAWGLLGLVGLVLYGRAERRARVFLVGSAACFFGAYLAKEPLVFFIPGALVAVWLAKRRLVDVVIHASVPLALLGLETLFYRSVSGFSSRFAIVSQTHGHTPFVIDHVFEVFGRFVELPSYWYPLLGLALVGAVGLPFITKERAFWPAVCVTASFFFCYTFAFRQLSPLTLWTRFLARYFDAAAPFAALVAVTFLVALGRWVRERYFPGWSAGLARVARFGPPAALGGLFVLGLTIALRKPPPGTGSVSQTRLIETILTDAYARGAPMVASRSNGYKALKAAYSLYVDDEVLVRDGKLPRYAKAYGRDDEMVRPDAPPLPPRCKIDLWVRDRWLKMERKTKLGPECK